MLELRTCATTWDNIALIDGLKAASSLVDARTELDNTLGLFPPGKQPTYHVVEPKITLMESRIADLDKVILRLKKQLHKMNVIIENLEAILFDAHKVRGWQWATEEPLWMTWPLERFVSSASQILVPYRRSLEMHIDIVNTLRSHSVPFETSRSAIADWAAQPHLDEEGWDARWEELCSVEIDGWD